MEINNQGMWKYIFMTYVVFWVMLIAIAGTASVVLNVSELTMRFIVILCSWAPTITLVIMYKKLVPNSSMKRFYKNAFSNRIDIKVLLLCSVFMFGIFALSIYIVSINSSASFWDKLEFTPSIVFPNLFFAITQGASGEESGWRGFLLPRMESRYGFVKGNLILGLVWGFWHMPLWFISGEYGGLDLLLYIVSFLVTIVSLSFLIAVVMRKSSNLFVAFWLHFIFNFAFSLYNGDTLEILIVLMIGYSLSLLMIIYLSRHRLLKKVLS